MFKFLFIGYKKRGILKIRKINIDINRIKRFK